MPFVRSRASLIGGLMTLCFFPACTSAPAPDPPTPPRRLATDSVENLELQIAIEGGQAIAGQPLNVMVKVKNGAGRSFRLTNAPWHVYEPRLVGPDGNELESIFDPAGGSRSLDEIGAGETHSLAPLDVRSHFSFDTPGHYQLEVKYLGVLVGIDDDTPQWESLTAALEFDQAPLQAARLPHIRSVAVFYSGTIRLTSDGAVLNRMVDGGLADDHHVIDGSTAKVRDNPDGPPPNQIVIGVGETAAIGVGEQDAFTLTAMADGIATFRHIAHDRAGRQTVRTVKIAPYDDGR